MKYVRSRDNPFFKSILKLKNSAHERRRTGTALLDGVHLIAAQLERSGPPLALVLSEAGLGTPEIERLIARLRSPRPVVLPDALFRQVSSVTSPSGILAVVSIPPAGVVAPEVEACVLIEDVQDPGNLGSLLRSAAAAGVHHVLLSRGCADAWSPRVLRGAMGAHHALTIAERADLAGFARAYQGQVVAADAGAARSIYDLDLTVPTAFVFGNEGAGLSPDLRQEADIAAAVPIASGIESLNVGAAAAVCLFERMRQMRTKR